MRVIVGTHHHFRVLPDGTVYPYSVFDYAFWCRYLEVFDEVVVFARLKKVNETDQANLPAKASGPGVSFFALPDFLGAWQYLKNYPKIAGLAKKVLRGNDVCILRVPSYLGTLLWHELMRTKRPYAVEVVGDPWAQLPPGRQSMKPKRLML